MINKAKDRGIHITKVITDLGSGMNYSKKGFKELLNLILSQKISKLILMYKDRLLRFGSEIIFNLCKYFNIEVIILEEKNNTSPLEKLSLDLVEIITVFSSRVYGMRSHANKAKT